MYSTVNKKFNAATFHPNFNIYKTIDKINIGNIKLNILFQISIIYYFFYICYI